MIGTNEHPGEQTQQAGGESTGTKDNIERFVALQRERRRIEAQLKPVKEELAQLEEALASEFAANGTQQIKRNGATVYLSRDVQLKAKDGTDAAVRQLLQSYPDMLALGHAKLKALVKECCYDAELETWELDSRKLPSEIAEAFDVSEMIKPRCRFS